MDDSGLLNPDPDWKKNQIHPHPDSTETLSNTFYNFPLSKKLSTLSGLSGLVPNYSTTSNTTTNN